MLKLITLLLLLMFSVKIFSQASDFIVVKKRNGIFIHQSQKDSVPFQGSDSREFWQRAEERNANTAKLYAELGLTQYAAMEAFVRYHY